MPSIDQANIARIEFARGKKMTKCHLCQQPGLPRYSRQDGVIVYGCIGSYHHDKLETDEQRAWHNRPKAKELRRKSWEQDTDRANSHIASLDKSIQLWSRLDATRVPELHKRRQRQVDYLQAGAL